MRAAMFSFAVAFVVATATAADEPIELKLKKDSVGDKAKVVTTEDGKTNVVIEVGGNEQVKKEKNSIRFAYTEEIVEKPAGAKKATKIKRSYETAEKDLAGKKQTLAYHGKTVDIEKVDGTYSFKVDGKVLDEDDAKDLDREFNKKADATIDNEDLLPKGKVKVGDTWKLDVARLVRSFTADSPFEVDEDKSTASGKLLKLYDKGGKKFGEIEIRIELVATGFKAGGDTIPLNKGSKVAVVSTIDVCVDGTTADGDVKTTVVAELDGEFPNGKLKINAESKQSNTGREIK